MPEPSGAAPSRAVAVDRLAGQRNGTAVAGVAVSISGGGGSFFDHRRPMIALSADPHHLAASPGLSLAAAVAIPAAARAAMSDALVALVERGETRRYRKGTVLIHEGDQGDTLFILLSGRMRAYSAGENGREVTYGAYGPGEYLGEVSLDGGPRSASVITLEPCTCVVVSRRTLERFIADRPEFAFELLAKVIRRVRVATLSVRQLALHDVYGRLKALLQDLAVRQADGTLQVAERLTHQEMSNRLGCSREMVSRLMKDLERGGYVTVVDNHYLLTKPLPQRW